MTDDADADANADAKSAAASAKIAEVQQTLKEKAPWLLVVYKVIVIVIGAVVTIAGIAMLVFPGPGWAVIFLGLGILSTQIPAVGRFIDRFKTWLGDVKDRFKKGRAQKRAQRRGHVG